MTTGVIGAAVLGLLLYAIPIGESQEFLGEKRGKGFRDEEWRRPSRWINVSECVGFQIATV